MATLLYIHGFLSSPQSIKAQQVKQWLSVHRPDIHYQCPQLTPYPHTCGQTLTEIIETADPPIYLMGSSLGGFWATWCSERFNLKAVLINPAVNVLEFFPDFIGRPLANYHNNESYRLTSEHLQELRSFFIEKPTRLANYWLLVQTGDETLDYRLAVAKYSGCRQTIEAGGDHSFQGFERHLEDAIAFFEPTNRQNSNNL